MLFDLHVHTTRGSGDSSLRPEELLSEALRLGLDGICLTEHSHAWTAEDAARLAAGTGLTIFTALEVETDFGHVLVFGANGYSPEMRRLGRLREIADRDGLALVMAHPFRHLNAPGPGVGCILAAKAGLGRGGPEQAAALPCLDLVHAIEAVNGATPRDDNGFAAAVAAIREMPATGGSDAHSIHGIGSGVTDVRGDPRSVHELAEAIRAGDVRAGMDLNGGDLRFIDLRRARALALNPGSE